MILNKADSVKEILVKRPRSRDEDRFLLASTWVLELRGQGYNVDDMTVREFMRLFVNSQTLTAPETIRRCRQKLQEHNPELRGKRYKQRQKVLEPEVRHEMRTE